MYLLFYQLSSTVRFIQSFLKDNLALLNNLRVKIKGPYYNKIINSFKLLHGGSDNKVRWSIIIFDFK